MRAIRVDCWCDVCHHAEPSRVVEAETYTVTVGPKPREVDLCADHWREFVMPLEVVLDEWGSAPGKAGTVKRSGSTRADGKPRWSTPRTGAALVEHAAGGMRYGREPEGGRNWQCLWCPLTYASSTGFLRHLSSVHGADSPATLVGIFGRTCPQCGEQFVSLGTHVSRAHAAANVSAACVEAAIDGDTFGVVERAHKALTENVTTSFVDLKARE